MLNINNTPLISITLVLPLIAALLIFLKKEDAKNHFAKFTAIIFSLLTLLASLIIFQNFDPNISQYQFTEKHQISQVLAFNYHVGIDGISIYFIPLTTLLTFICILSSFSSIKKRLKEFLICFLVLETFILGIFTSLNFLLFYLFFEIVLIPMFLIIGIWGGENRIYAALKFFLYTLAGSILLLIALIYIYVQTGTMDITILTNELPHLPLLNQKWLWLAFFASFAVKVPMFPFHTWLPDAHVQAPTAGSVILAGILLKLGGYGFLRFSLPMLPDASQHYADFVLILSSIAVIYTSVIALMQTDMKKLIAYSSVAHMAYVTAGIFTFNLEGAGGAIIQMISHGLVSSALFLAVGVLYDRMHTKEIAKYGGVTNVMPKFALIFLFFTMASVGLPGTSGFAGEFISLIGIFKANSFYAFCMTSGLILGACYMLWLFKRVMLGSANSEEIQKMPDLTKTELFNFMPLIILTIFFGIYITSLTSYFEKTVQEKIVNHMIKH